jgi:hypothetical protein
MPCRLSIRLPELHVRAIVEQSSVSCSTIALVCIGALALPAAAGPLPWWQRETAMSAAGRLTMLDKPWWTQAKTLKEGERFTLDLNHDGRPDTIVTRLNGDIVEAIDDTAQAADIWNQVNTTFVVSYEGTGVVDRMVSYIDDDARGHATEVELRYFRNGYLRYAWFGRSYGGNAAKLFALKRWQYAGNDQGSEFRGNAQIYIDKYDAKTGTWAPLSECPFSFWDMDHDGRTDVTLRVSATPLEALARKDTDYANNYDYMWAPDAVPAQEIVASNMRLSFNIDARPRNDALEQPHSNFSFTMVGHQPYSYPEMVDFNPRRRPPQTTVHMPWALRWKPALEYPAEQTGFTWDETRTNLRWEGQFWIYERQYLSNTGSPTERWNMRREFSPDPSSRRDLYFSAADERYHLKGAREAWMEVGHMVNDIKDLELRWWDASGRGYLDTLEVYRGNSTEPIWVQHFDPRTQPAALDIDALAKQYNGTVLPESIAIDRQVIAALKGHVEDALAAQYAQAATGADSLERERYCLDIARLLYYLRLRERLMAEEASSPYASWPVDVQRFRDPAPESSSGNAKAYTLGDSERFWSLVRTLHRMDAEYANGDFVAFRATLAHLARAEDGNALTH